MAQPQGGIMAQPQGDGMAQASALTSRLPPDLGWPCARVPRPGKTTSRVSLGRNGNK